MHMELIKVRLFTDQFRLSIDMPCNKKTSNYLQKFASGSAQSVLDLQLGLQAHNYGEVVVTVESIGGIEVSLFLAEVIPLGMISVNEFTMSIFFDSWKFKLVMLICVW